MVILDYHTSGGKNVIIEYIENLPIRKKVFAYRIREKISKNGLEIFEILETRQLRGKLYEIKFLDQRIIYVVKDAKSVYFLHICKKQKGKTMKKDLDTALRRAKEIGYKI